MVNHCLAKKSTTHIENQTSITKDGVPCSMPLVGDEVTNDKQQLQRKTRIRNRENGLVNHCFLPKRHAISNQTSIPKDGTQGSIPLLLGKVNNDKQ